MQSKAAIMILTRFKSSSIMYGQKDLLSIKGALHVSSKYQVYVPHDAAMQICVLHKMTDV